MDTYALTSLLQFRAWSFNYRRKIWTQNGEALAPAVDPKTQLVDPGAPALKTMPTVYFLADDQYAGEEFEPTEVDEPGMVFNTKKYI